MELEATPQQPQQPLVLELADGGGVMIRQPADVWQKPNQHQTSTSVDAKEVLAPSLRD